MLADIPLLTPAANPTQQYWMYLGRFVSQFANIEALLHRLLQRYSHVNYMIGIALFSDMRIDASISRIKRLLEMNFVDNDIKQELGTILEQLSIINQVRNDILHFGVGPGSKLANLVTSNRGASLSLDRVRETPISAEILYRMELDLHKIGIHIIVHLDKSGNARRQYGKALDEPWHYIHPQQDELYPHKNLLAQVRASSQSQAKSKRRRRGSSPT